MIVNCVYGDILESNHDKIIFATNSQGINTCGFAGLVAARYWPELANIGQFELGDILTANIKDRTFYAIVCHELDKYGWINAGTFIKEALDSIYLPSHQVMGMVMAGTGPIGVAQGADAWDILSGIAQSNKLVEVYKLK